VELESSMKRYVLVISFLLFVLTSFGQSTDQKVALVLSGGAAKGLAHIGVLKALEENDIPIDYIVGTSMGGIIGGCYAAGMSPTEIENMVLSKEFLGWINGSPQHGFNYRYPQNDINPSFLRVDLAVDSLLNLQFNSSLANDVALNFVLTEKMAQAGAISNRNFDRLFIPLRVIAADIFTQNEVVLKSGSLSEALRATQSVPFFYSPIRINGKYLFDGGVYNNFPVDVAERDFKPEVVIGVNVSTSVFEEYPYDKDDLLISKSLLYLLLSKSDPSKVPPHGVFIQPNMQGITSFDFSKARSLIDTGYAQTIRQMDEIKQKISARRAISQVNEKRQSFLAKQVPLEFGDLKFTSYNSRQREYIRRVFRTKNNGAPQTIEDIKRGYFKLVSEDFFGNTYPNILYDSIEQKFHLHLYPRPQKNFQIDFGGQIATRDISNIYLGLHYYHFGRNLKHTYAAFQTGGFYKSALVKTRIDFPVPVYVEPIFKSQNWDYLGSSDLLKNIASNSISTALKRSNTAVGVSIGIPVKESFRLAATFENFRNHDRFINGDYFISTDTLDVLKLQGIKTGLNFSANSLNKKQYPSIGKMLDISLDYFDVNENYSPGNSSVVKNRISDDHRWFRLKVTGEQYFGKGFFKTGYVFQGVLSTQKPFRNYYATIINAPAYQPLQDSPTLILQNFRSFNYTAVGMRNILSFTPKLEGRLEAHLFKPFDYLTQNNQQEVVIEQKLNSLFFAASIGLVYHSPIGPISLSTNYYDDKENPLGILLHAGFLLFQKHTTE
jgi:NTE family protein